MVQRVGDDVVLRPENGRYRTGVGGESGLEDDARLDVFEPRDPLFKLHVDGHGSGDRSHRARSYAVSPRGFERRFAQFAMRGQPEVVVRGEIDYLAAVEARYGRALRLQYTQRLICTGSPPGGKLFSKVSKRVVHD